MKAKRRKPSLIGRLGPKTNIRPAGAHEDRKVYNRKNAKIALRQALAEGDSSIRLSIAVSR